MIKPQIPKGFRDFLPKRKLLRKRVIEKIQNIFELFGFEPLETPGIEYAETLEGKYGEEGEKLIYKFEDRGRRKVALRYDLTIPLCRVVSMYPEISKPFKCYQIAPVWRADKPQKGRFREFYQCDIDIVGTESKLADAELVFITYLVLKQLNFKNFVIHINNRKLLNALARKSGITDRDVPSFFRSLDKLEKIGSSGVSEELVKKGFSNSVIKNVFAIIDASTKNKTSLADLKPLIKGIHAGEEAVEELEIIHDALKAQGVPESYYCFDFVLARGLDYYTGPIFETVVETPAVGSITGGGRYDNLIGLFSKKAFPATGMSLGLERLITVIEESCMDHKLPDVTTQVLVTLFDTELSGTTLQIAQLLRNAGLKTETYLKPDKLKKQLAYAANKNIPVVVILGPDEVNEGMATLKIMATGKQEIIPQNNIVKRIEDEIRGDYYQASK